MYECIMVWFIMMQEPREIDRPAVACCGVGCSKSHSLA